jgi:hypothetical protein
MCALSDGWRRTSVSGVITRIVGGHPQSQIDQLMPGNYAKTSDAV